MSSLQPEEGRLRTRCSECTKEFYIGTSLAMQFGLNSGHGSCPRCQTFLHFEALEGDIAWSEKHSDWLSKVDMRGPSILPGIVKTESDGAA
jgi:hypothetical protein